MHTAQAPERSQALQGFDGLARPSLQGLPERFRKRSLQGAFLMFIGQDLLETDPPATDYSSAMAYPSLFSDPAVGSSNLQMPLPSLLMSAS